MAPSYFQIYLSILLTLRPLNLNSNFFVCSTNSNHKFSFFVDKRRLITTLISNLQSFSFPNLQTHNHAIFNLLSFQEDHKLWKDYDLLSSDNLRLVFSFFSVFLVIGISCGAHIRLVLRRFLPKKYQKLPL